MKTKFLAAVLIALFATVSVNADLALINEIHYDNAGGDVGEAVEIAFEAGGDITQLTINLVNGNGGTVYNSTTGSGALTAGQTNVNIGGVIYDLYTWSLPPNGLQNGAPDGIAIATAMGLQEFLSYEGSFAAVGGIADGVTSTDIGVAESSATPIGGSLQRNNPSGDGWFASETNTFGATNAIPEPSSVVALTALAGLAFNRRRRG